MVVLVLVDVLVLVLVLADIGWAAVLDVVRFLDVGTDEQHRQAVELLGRRLSKLSR